MNRLGRLGVMLLAVTLTRSPAAAQEPGQPPLPTVLEGLTVDASSGLPFPNVQLRFDTGERVTSDLKGQYVIEGLTPGYHRVALVTGRCKATFADLELEPGQIKRIAFQVPTEMVGLEPSHEELRQRSEGDYYSAEDLGNARNLLDALRRVAPDMVGPEGAMPGASASLMGRTRTAQGVIAPIVVFDGVPVGDGVAALRDFKPADVYSLEVLRGASRGWAYGTGGAGGVIRIVTQKGDVGFGVQHPDRCDIGDWPGSTGIG